MSSGNFASNESTKHQAALTRPLWERISVPFSKPVAPGDGLAVRSPDAAVWILPEVDAGRKTFILRFDADEGAYLGYESGLSINAAAVVTTSTANDSETFLGELALAILADPTWISNGWQTTAVVRPRSFPVTGTASLYELEISIVIAGTITVLPSGANSGIVNFDLPATAWTVEVWGLPKSEGAAAPLNGWILLGEISGTVDGKRQRISEFGSSGLIGDVSRVYLRQKNNTPVSAVVQAWIAWGQDA